MHNVSLLLKVVLFLSVYYVSGVLIVNSTGVTTVKDNLCRSTPSERNMTHFASKRISGTVINDLTMM